MGSLLPAFVLAAALPASGPTPACSPAAGDDWVQLSDTQASPDLVKALSDEEPIPERIKCVEAVFTNSGLDVVTESQWGLVLGIVVSRDGRVERFRIFDKPPLPINFQGPLSEALSRWRFEPWTEDGQPVATCHVFLLMKPMGHRVSKTCDDGR